MKLPTCLVALLLLLAGCSSVDTQFNVLSDARRYHHLFVRTALNDSNNLDQVIVRELQRLGYDAASGPRTMMPDNSDAYLEYQAQWDWDFRTYIIRLTLTVRDVKTDNKVADGMVFHPGYTNKSPEELVRRVVDPMFGPKDAKK